MFAGDGPDRELLFDAAPGGAAHVEGAIEVGPLLVDDAGEALGIVGGASRPCLKSLIEPAVAGDRRGDERHAERHGLEQAMLMPSSREGRTNRSASRSSGGRRRPRRRATRRRLGPSAEPRPNPGFQRGPLGTFADQDQPGRGMRGPRPPARRRSGHPAPSRAPAGRRRPREAPSASRAAAARERRDRDAVGDRHDPRSASSRQRRSATSCLSSSSMAWRDRDEGVAGRQRRPILRPKLPHACQAMSPVAPAPSGRSTTGKPSRRPAPTVT